MKQQITPQMCGCIYIYIYIYIPLMFHSLLFVRINVYNVSLMGTFLIRLLYHAVDMNNSE